MKRVWLLRLKSPAALRLKVWLNLIFTVQAGSAYLIEVNCETDFVAKTPEFQMGLFVIIAMQVAAANPAIPGQDRKCRRRVVEHEKEVLKAQALNEGKPAKIVDKMVEGRVEKYLQGKLPYWNRRL